MFVRYLRIAAIGMGLAIGSSATGAAAASSATHAGDSVDAATAKRIDTGVRQVLHRFDVPGAAILVIRGGKRIYAHAYGERDKERRLEVRTDTPFEIGSITKQFTAAAIVQLQEAGKLGLDHKLADYLPQAPHAHEVTLRQLLTHTSGLHEYFDGPEKEVDELAMQPIDFEHLIARIADKPLDFPPGTRWSYSNTGYALLGKVIETVSGQRYRDYVQQHLLDPLAMKRTFTLADKDRLGDMAVGYRHEQGALRRAPFFHPDWSGAAGFLVSTLDDLARWDAGLRGGDVISKAGYAEMSTPFVTSGGDNVGYGLGLFVNTLYGQPRIGHTGGTQGFTTADEYFPDLDTRVIAFTNLGDKQPEAGITLTNVVFAVLHPDIAAAWNRPAAGEDKAVGARVKASFLQLQAGKNYGAFSTSLAGKLAGGLGTRFADTLRSYGKPSAVVFKGKRQGDKGLWYDYVAEFGPGVFMPYAVRPDEDGRIAGFALD